MTKKHKRIIAFLVLGSLTGAIASFTIYFFTRKKKVSPNLDLKIINNISAKILQGNDGIDKNTDLSLLSQKEIQEKITSYLLERTKSNRFKVQVKDFKASFQKGTLQYTIILFGNSFPKKEIKIRYAIGELENKSQAFLRKQELEYINSAETREDFKKTIINLLKISKTQDVPDEPPNLESGIQNFINSHGIIENWNVEIQDYKNNPIFGSLSFIIILSKNYPVVGMRSRKILMKYPSGSFKVDQKKINEIEQLEINKITSDDIKNHDGINKSKNLLPLDQPQGLAEKLKNSVKSLKKFKNWRVRISNYNSNQEKGSLKYIVTLTKTGFNLHTIEVLYPDKSFLTTAESNKLKEIEIIKKLNTDSLWANDEIRPETNVDTITKETLKTTLANYVNNIIGVSGWKAEITLFHKDIGERSLTYKVKFTKAGFLTSKVIEVEYPKNSLANTEIMNKRGQIDKELQTIRDLKISDLKKIDNIKPDKTKIAPKIKDWAIWGKDLETKIKNKIKELTTHNPKHIQWKVEVSEQIRNPLGSISYKVTIESKDYSPLEIKTLPIYYTNEFQSDEEHEWEKEKQLLEEKIKVKDIDIKGNDQITPSKSEIPPLEMPTNSNKNIQKHINDQLSKDKDSIQWKTNIKKFESNPKEGSVLYKIEIFQERTEEKLKKTGKTLTINYPAGSFKTQKEVLDEKWEKLKGHFTTEKIKKNDGVRTTKEYLPSDWRGETWVEPQLRTLVINSWNQETGFDELYDLKQYEMSITNFKKDDEKGSISYKFNFSTTGNWESEVKDYEYNFTVIIEYDPGDFKTKKEHEEEIVSKILPKDLKAVDEITPATDTTKKDIAPNKPENLETKLANFVNAKPNASGWTAKVDNYEKSPKGSLSYDVTFKKNGFQDKKVSILYRDNSFLTETEIMDDLAKKAKAADGITADSTKPIPNKPTDLETKLANFIINHYGLDGSPNINLEFEVTNYQKDESEGSLSYDVIFKRKPGSMTIDGKAINFVLKKLKKITVTYKSGSFKTSSE